MCRTSCNGVFSITDQPLEPSDGVPPQLIIGGLLIPLKTIQTVRLETHSFSHPFCVTRVVHSAQHLQTAHVDPGPSASDEVTLLASTLSRSPLRLAGVRSTEAIAFSLEHLTVVTLLLLMDPAHEPMFHLHRLYPLKEPCSTFIVSTRSKNPVPPSWSLPAQEPLFHIYHHYPLKNPCSTFIVSTRSRKKPVPPSSSLPAQEPLFHIYHHYPLKNPCSTFIVSTRSRKNPVPPSSSLPAQEPLFHIHRLCPPRNPCSTFMSLL